MFASKTTTAPSREQTVPLARPNKSALIWTTYGPGNYLDFHLLTQ